MAGPRKTHEDAVAAKGAEYLYVSPRLDGLATFVNDALADTPKAPGHPDVHELTSKSNALEELHRRNGLAGVVIGLTSGLPDRARLEIAEAGLERGLRVWLYWPNEHAVECVDRERLGSFKRHRRAVIVLERAGRPFPHSCRDGSAYPWLALDLRPFPGYPTTCSRKSGWN